MNYHVSIAGRDYVVTINSDGVQVDGIPVKAELVPVSGDASTGRCVVKVDNQALAVDYQHEQAKSPGGVAQWHVGAHGSTIGAVVLDERERAIRDMAAATARSRGPSPIRAPMPGMVVKIEVSVGDTVEVGQGVVVVEAMKMENELQAQSSGVVATIHVDAGTTVEKDQVLIEFQAPETEVGHG